MELRGGPFRGACAGKAVGLDKGADLRDKRKGEERDLILNPKAELGPTATATLKRVVGCGQSALRDAFSSVGGLELFVVGFYVHDGGGGGRGLSSVAKNHP